MVLSFTANSHAVEFERKIIIQNNTFYYVTVDDNHQMGTLYTGDISSPLKLAKAFAIPAGRGISAQTNPLAWDIHNNNLFAVNFIDHSLNDRNEAIKEIPLSDLQPWSTQSNSVENLIMKSVDYPIYALNEPYLFTVKQSMYMNHFYFDGVFVGDAYWMAVSNNGNMMIWKYENAEWTHSEELPFEVSNYFNLFVKQGNLALITAEGLVYRPNLESMGQIIMKSKITDLNGTILVEDRDNGIVYMLNSDQLNYEKSLQDMLRDTGQKL